MKFYRIIQFYYHMTVINWLLYSVQSTSEQINRFKFLGHENEWEAVFLAGPEIYFLISELQIQSPFPVYRPILRSLKRRAIRQTLPMIHRYSVQGSTGLAFRVPHVWAKKRKRESGRQVEEHLPEPLINPFPIGLLARSC